MSQLLKVGKIANTHGLKGEVKVIALTDNPKRFKDLEYVIIDGKNIAVEGCKFQKDRVIVELEEDCYFIADLRECTVFDIEGKELGQIYDVIQTKNNDVYWIRKPKELLIPVLKSIVTDINIDERKIIIRPVGEWMDED